MFLEATHVLDSTDLEEYERESLVLRTHAEITLKGSSVSPAQNWYQVWILNLLCHYWEIGIVGFYYCHSQKDSRLSDIGLL